MKISHEEALLNSNPSEVVSFVHKNLLNKEIDEKFNWFGLAEGADDNARSGLSLEWALVATLVYENLFSRGPFNSTHYDNCIYLRRSMALRAVMIKRLGSVDGNNIQDTNYLLSLFFGNLTITYEEALSLSAEYNDRRQKHTLNSMEKEKRSQMIKIKDQLVILQDLADNKCIQVNPQLAQWLAVLEELQNQRL